MAKAGFALHVSAVLFCLVLHMISVASAAGTTNGMVLYIGLLLTSYILHFLARTYKIQL